MLRGRQRQLWRCYPKQRNTAIFPHARTCTTMPSLHPHKPKYPNSPSFHKSLPLSSIHRHIAKISLLPILPKTCMPLPPLHQHKPKLSHEHVYLCHPSPTQNKISQLPLLPQTCMPSPSSRPHKPKHLSSPSSYIPVCLCRPRAHKNPNIPTTPPSTAQI